MALESELLEEPVGIISTGLGGAQHRLRYLVAIGLSCGSLRDAQRRRLESVWRTICERHDSVLERVNFHPTHVLLTLLISMETAVGTVIDAGIAAANGDAPILRRNYFVTNVAVRPRKKLSMFSRRYPETRRLSNADMRQRMPRVCRRNYWGRLYVRHYPGPG